MGMTFSPEPDEDFPHFRVCSDPTLIKVINLPWWLNNSIEIKKWVKSVDGKVTYSLGNGVYIKLQNEADWTYINLRWG